MFLNCPPRRRRSPASVPGNLRRVSNALRDAGLVLQAGIDRADGGCYQVWARDTGEPRAVLVEGPPGSIVLYRARQVNAELVPLDTLRRLAEELAL